MNILRTVFSLLACSHLALFVGCESKDATSPVAMPGSKAAQSDVGNANRPAVDRVTAGPPVKKTLQLFTEQPGRVVAFEEAPLLSKLSGYVESAQCDIGDKVSKGQVLIRLNAPEYKDQLEQKRGILLQIQAQVKQAEAALLSAKASTQSAAALVAQAEASTGRTDAEFARWESELKRIQQLVSKGSVTPKLADETSSQFQSAVAAKKETLASIESARAQQREAEAKIVTAEADIEAAKAKLSAAQADVAQAETMLAYTSLVAPFDGVVTARTVHTGHYVQPAGANNNEPLMTIANISKVRVFVNVPESEATWVSAGFGASDAGDPVTISSPALPNGKIEARVTRTNLSLDPQSRTLSAEIDLENSDSKIMPGAYVTAKILLEKRDDVWTLPISAIVKSSDGTRCCLVVDGKIKHQPIELGLRVGDEVEVKSGLNGTEAVVLLRSQSLQAGQEVEVIIKK